MPNAPRAANPAQTGTHIQGVLMTTRASAVAACSALLGLMLGISFGQDWGWATAQAALAAQFALLRHVNAQGSRPARLALAGACFEATMALAGYAGFALSLATGFSRTLLLAGLLLIPLHALLGAGAALLSARISGNSLLRWALTWPALYALQEWLLGQSDFALPWLRLGSLQAAPGPLAGLLPLGGSLLTGLAMGWCAVALLALRQRGPARRRAAATLLALLSLSAIGRLDWTHASGELQAAFVQPPQAGEAGTGQTLNTLLHAVAESPAQLLITPQLMLAKTEQALPPGLLDQMRMSLAAHDADLLLGLHAQAPSGFYNAALGLGASGDQHYLKRQLFPGGEFLPAWGPLRDWLQASLPMRTQDMARAHGPEEPLWLGGHRVSVNICFELAFASLWREEAAASELIVNLSSDSSHPGDGLARQARQLAQARAMEFQKPVLRSTDVGPGLAVDHQGHVLDVLAGTARLQPRQGLTPFAMLGDSLAVGAALFCLLAALLAGPARKDVHNCTALRILGRGRVAQTGQILMATVALLLVSAAMLYFMVNSGQAVTEKMRVTNAADAGAYSAGVVEARALNHDAYLNRAMVANEIAIAQMVSVGSWTRYFANAVDEVPDSLGDMVTMLAPSLDAYKIVAIFAATKVALKYYTGRDANDYADYVLEYGIGPIIMVHDAVVGAMSLAQQVVHLNLLGGIRQGQIAGEAAQAMDPSLKTQVVLISHGFDLFTKSYSGNDRGRFADVTMRSRDAFSRERNWTVDSPNINIPVIGKKDGALKKRAGTELIGYDEWRGMDTLELHGRKWNCGKWHFSLCGDIEKPLGWSAVQIKAGGGGGRGYHGNAYGENNRTAHEAEDNMEEPGNYHFSGLPSAQELRDFKPDADLTTGITIFVTKNHAALMTSGGMAKARPAGELALFSDKPAGARLAALSRAQIFFDRIAQRADGKTEIGSLYNPYWRVRLVAPTLADRAWAATQQGGLALP